MPVVSSKEEQRQHTERNKAAQYDPISPLLRANPPHQTVNPRYLSRRAYNPPINARQSLPLHPEILVDSISLAQHTICHAMTIVYPPPLI